MPLNECDVLTSKSVDARLVELNAEFKFLQNFKKEFPGSSAEWDLGVTFVKDSFLANHVKEIAAQCLDLDSWPLKYVDWERAVEDYKKKYEPVHFGGIIYWTVSD
jgi:hypothetical protein